jgi:hypothetical protein
VSVIDAARKGVQLSLYCGSGGAISPRFYRYGPAGGLEAVTKRTSASRVKVTRNGKMATMLIRIPWTDLEVKPGPGVLLHVNVAAYPRPDSPRPTHASSLWLIGDCPAWNAGYWGLLRLGKEEK